MRLEPRAFWAMSLVEWRAAVDGRIKRRAMPLARADFETMMKEHPDG